MGCRKKDLHSTKQAQTDEVQWGETDGCTDDRSSGDFFGVMVDFNERTDGPDHTEEREGDQEVPAGRLAKAMFQAEEEREEGGGREVQKLENGDAIAVGHFTHL